MTWPILNAEQSVVTLANTTTVIDRRTGRLLALDRMGEFVLSHREGFADLDDAASALHDAFGTDRAVIHVALGAFEAALESTRYLPTELDPFTEWIETAPRADRLPPANVTQHSWCVDALGLGVRVTVHGNTLRSILTPVITSFKPASAADLEIVTWLENDLISAVLGAKVLFERVALEHGVNQIVTWITAAAVGGPREHLAIHAGCVVYQGRGILLVAPANQGKSSTVVELMCRGAVYLTDEAVALELGTKHVEGFARPIGLEGPFRALHPELRPPWWPNASTYPRWPVPPQALGDVTDSTDLDGIVFLSLESGLSTCENIRVDPLVALARLCHGCFNPASLTPECVVALEASVRDIPLIELRHPGAVAAADALSVLVAGL